MKHRHPFVSCIMPTRDRVWDTVCAVSRFNQQVYPAKSRELIILDGTQGSMFPDGNIPPWIRYYHEPEITLGDKRNRLVKLARGDLILHWDDDDYHAPDRISRQVTALLAANASVCGLSPSIRYLDLRDGTRYLYSYNGPRPWLCGASLLYTRDFWARYPFPPLQVGSDTAFLFDRPPGWERHAVFMPDLDLLTATIHDGNTSPKDTTGPNWTRLP